MIQKIVRLFIRNIADEWRLRLVTICMVESAMVRPGQILDAHLSIEKDGTYDIYYNGVVWSYPKKDRAREMMAGDYTLAEVAAAFGVTPAELTNQLLDREPIEQIAERHNNLNHCNAAGCDGVQCGPEHIKGDF